MQRTYQITPGAQYLPDGVTVYSRVGNVDQWATFDAAGKWLDGHFGPVDHLEQISSAAARVGTSRTAETITVGEPEVSIDRGPLYPADWCHECYNPRRRCEC